MPTHSSYIRTRIAIAAPPMHEAGRAIAEHPRLTSLLPEYFVAIHQMIRASVPLMATALNESLGRAHEDPLAARLLAYYGQHIDEEFGHDDWMLADIAAVGMTEEAVTERLPLPSVAALVGSQYYWIKHHHPVMLLGYVAVVEGYPPSEESAAELANRSGYPFEAFSTLRKHARLDVHHRDDLDRFLDGLPLTPYWLDCISVNALQTVGQVASALRDIVARHDAARTPGTEQVHQVGAEDRP